MSSRHEGVSCDGCMAPSFTGDRYKCLRCYDFDLCSRCYAEERRGKNERSRDTNSSHQPNHPMQCIMTQQDFERTYRGDPAHSWERSRVVIFTCPVCGAQGFPRERLVSHVIEEHPSFGASSSSHNKREEMACPICISTDSSRIGFADCAPNHLTDMAAHMAEYHSHTSSTPNGIGQNVQSATTGFNEYLRDDDLRRVILNNIPLVGDFELDDSLSESARRHINALLSSNRVAVNAFCHPRRRAERSGERSGHEEEGSSQSATGGSRSLSYSSRSTGFGRHWPSISTHRQSGSSFFNSLPFRQRPMRQTEAESTRTISSTSQSNAVLRFIHRDFGTNGSSAVATSRAAQPIGVLIRPVRRSQQNASSDRGTNENNPRQQLSRSGSRFTDFDRSGNSRYNREFMRSFFESARRTERSPLNRRRAFKTSSGIGDNSTDKAGPSSSKSEREPQRNEKQLFLSPSTSAATSSRSNSVRRSDCNFLDETAVKEPLLVERAGKAMLLLPQSSSRTRSVENVAVTGKLSRSKKSVKVELKKNKNEKTLQNEKKSKKKRERQQLDVDQRLRWLQSYQPLFTASAEPVFPLPVVHISENDEDKQVWSKPKPIPELVVSSKKDPETEDDVSDEADVSQPTLILRVGRPVRCTYSSSDSKNDDTINSSVEGTARNKEALLIRKTLDAIKKMEEDRKAEAAESSSSSKKSVQGVRQDEEKHIHQKQSSPPTASKSQKSYKAEELSRMDSVDRYQNAFKEATEDLLLGAVVVERQSCYKPFHVISEELSNTLMSKWVEQERDQAGERLGIGLPLDSTIKSLMSQIPDFSDEESIEESIFEWSDEEPMFDPSEGTDNDLLAKKCISCGILQTPSSHFAVGPMNAALNEKENFENDYWKNYRFLHNRRDAFLLRKSIESPPENTLDSSDWRFARQLLLGARDVPASKFLRCHFFDNAYNIVLECNLRSLIRRQIESSSEESATSEEESVDEKSPEVPNGKFLMSFDETSTRVISDTKLINVHPVLWHFLDLSGFVAE